MVFKYLEKAEFDALTPQQQEAYAKSKREHEAKQVEETAKGVVSEATKDLVSKEDFNALEDKLKTALEEVETLKENGEMKVQKTLTQEIKEKKESLVKAVKNGEGEVALKALTQRSSVANSPSGFILPDIGQLGVKERSLYNVLPKISISDSNTHGNVRYRDWDEATTVRAAAMVAEGAAFPESTATWQWYSIPLRKIGDTLPVTEEFFEDEAQAASELDRFLDINVNLVVDDQLINGDNTGQNLNGFLNVAPTYTAVASGIADPNLKDLVIKMRNTITRTRGSKYRPDMVLVSSSTMETLVLAKDANNNYIFDENTGTLGGLTVVVDENMPDNQLIVGDRRFATIYEKDGVTISRGMINGQFVEDEMTIKARKRLLFLVRTVDQTGFLKSADVTADLTTLGTP
jgi:predicted phage gp36 major capsid-like protein